MLTGELPGRRIDAPSKKFHLYVRLDEIVLRALEKEPQRRYQQASQFKTQVETIASTPQSSSRRESAPEEQSRLRPTGAREPNFSRTAIIGGVWATFFFINQLMFAWVRNAAEYHGPPRWQPLLLFIFLPLGV